MSNQETKANKNQPAGKFVFHWLVVLTLILGVMDLSPFTALATTASVAPPTGAGPSDSWTANTGTKSSAVAINDGDSTYISSSTNGSAQTFSFPGAGVPVGATIDSVTLTTVAKKNGDVIGNPQIKMLAENGTTTATEFGFSHLLSSPDTYSSFTWTMTQNPITSAAWTVAEVNSWTLRFGVSKESASGEARVTQLSLTVDYTAHPAPVTNPSLGGQTCGLDVALVIDNSGSISASELTTMKNAFKGFVNTLLPSTPTEFSVTKFGTTASMVQGFTGSATTTNTAIDGTFTDGSKTNWEDGLLKAQSTFDPRAVSSHPNLIVFASDGVPNKYNVYDGSGNITGTAGTGGTSVDQNALDAAVTEANVIKNLGTRIITLGIGVTGTGAVDNLKAISSSDAYYDATDFSALSAQLAVLANDICGSTITINKKIDADGNLATTGDQSSGGAGWTFAISGGHSGIVTDENGQTAAVSVSPDSTYSITETSQSGFQLVSATCTGATNPGTGSTSGIAGLQVNGNDIVSCTFYNKPVSTPPSGTDVGITKTANKATANVGDTIIYTVAVKNNGATTATGVTVTDILPSTLTYVSSSATVGSFNSSTGSWSVGSLTAGATQTLTITATVKAETEGLTITNTGMVTSTSTDSNSDNNSSSASFTVNRTNINQFTLTVTTSGNGTGKVTSNDEHINCHSGSEANCVFTYNEGAAVTLTATADAGSTFTDTWTGACTGNNPACALTMNANKNTNAHFSLVTGGGGGGSSGGSISGLVYEDQNGNGIFDGGDTGQSGWVVTLSGTSSGSITTPGGGAYAFGSLTDGIYTVCAALQTNWSRTAPGGGGTCPDGAKSYNITISGGNALTGQDFGNRRSATSGGGGGGGGCGAACGQTIAPPPGQVLGAVTPTPAGPGLQMPLPQVQGAATQLPRTGVPAGLVIALGMLSIALAFGARKIWLRA